MTRRRPTARTIQQTPDLGLRVRLQREVEPPGPSDPVRILDHAGEVIERIPCGDDYQLPAPPPAPECEEITNAYWAEPLLRSDDPWIDPEDPQPSWIDGLLMMSGVGQDHGEGLFAQDFDLHFQNQWFMDDYGLETLTVHGIATTTGDPAAIEWDVEIERHPDMADEPTAGADWWLGATWSATGPLLTLNIGAGESYGVSDVWSYIIATPRCGEHEGPTIRIAVGSAAY